MKAVYFVQSRRVPHSSCAIYFELNLWQSKFHINESKNEINVQPRAMYELFPVIVTANLKCQMILAVFVLKVLPSPS